MRRRYSSNRGVGSWISHIAALGIGAGLGLWLGNSDLNRNFFTQKQDKLYVAYLSAHVAALVYALAYSVSDGFTRDVPIYPFY